MSYEYLDLAIEKSRESVNEGGFPVGAVVAVGGEVISTGISNGKILSDPSSHAEMVAIRKACTEIGSRNLGKTAILYSSMEPCLMCYGASVWASIPRLVFAIRRESLSPQHFEGDHNLNGINASTRRPINLIHAASFERQALSIVEQWETLQEARL